MGALIGPQIVSCPSCRSIAGRPCVDARGYLYEGGAHARRREAWMQVETAELEALRGETPAGA